MHTTMKDSLNHLLRDRFQGHEAPVDPATWQVIEARLLTGVPAADQVNNLFRERFQQHELHVDPAVWQGVSAQLGHTAGAGLLGGFGWVAAGLAGVAVIVGAILNLNSEPKVVADAKIDQVVTAPFQVESINENVAPTVSEVIAPVEEQSNSTASNGTTNHADRAKAQVPAPKKAEPMAVIASKPEPKTVPPTTVPVVAAASSASRNGAAVVNEIIAEITDQVEEEVRSTPPPSVNPSTTPNPSGSAASTEPDLLAPPAKPFMPNAFTPNNDGINDFYLVPMEGYTSMLLRVYSLKSNQLVFSTNNGEPWSGANCEDGMYLVALEAMTTDGRVVSEGKVVWLNRSGMN